MNDTTAPEQTTEATEQPAPAAQTAADGASLATEGKPETEAPSTQADSDKPAENEKPSGPPEKYEFTPPEGFEVDPEGLKGYEDLAREAGLTQEQFGKVTEYGLKYMQQQLGKVAEQAHQRQLGWRNDALADTGLTDGKTLLPEVKQNAALVMDQFGGDHLRKALDETGAGNHPAVIRALNEIGKAIGAAKPPDTGKPAPQNGRGNSIDSIAERMYGNGA